MTQNTQSNPEPTLSDVLQELKEYRSEFEKSDKRLWVLSIALVTTAWGAIIAASAIVIIRSLAGR